MFLEDAKILAWAKTDRKIPPCYVACLLPEDGGADVSRSTIENRLQEFEGRHVTAVMNDLIEDKKQARI
ncbi:hypothetical protein BV898_10894 [Hypsibius exemplaris]|uniref:Uncharacterized protein n=1 Tax=Hypsibius exemplaris TaxID=2072580 RepID=A0A1W0WI64_HYPEX|nr:hypothetical protein BV898_10894 [Hypsibius exemplaris]